MLIALIHSCENKYAHTPMRVCGSWVEGEYSRNQILSYVAEYKQRFNGKRVSALKVIVVDLIPEENKVEILENLDLKNELPKRTIINPAKAGYKASEKTPRKFTVTPTVQTPAGLQVILDGWIDTQPTQTF